MSTRSRLLPFIAVVLIVPLILPQHTADSRQPAQTKDLYADLLALGYQPIIPSRSDLQPGALISYVTGAESIIAPAGRCAGVSAKDYKNTDLLSKAYESKADGSTSSLLTRLLPGIFSRSLTDSPARKIQYTFSSPFTWAVNDQTLLSSFKSGRNDCIDAALTVGAAIVHDIVGARGINMQLFDMNGEKITTKDILQRLLNADSKLQFSIGADGTVHVDHELFLGYRITEGFVGAAAGPASRRDTFYTAEPQNTPARVTELLSPPNPPKRPGAYPQWNAWLEEPYSSIPSFTPAKARPNSDYSLVLNLAALGIEDNPRVWTQTISSDFSAWIELHNKSDSATIELVLAPDPRFFVPVGGSNLFQPMQIHLDNMRKIASEGLELKEPLLTALRRTKGNATFSYGTQTLHIRTGNAVGTGIVSIAVWLDGRPVDEISIPVCIQRSAADVCAPQAANAQSLRGIDLSKASGIPDAAFHLIDAGSEMVAVFRCDSCDREQKHYLVWHMLKDSDWFGVQLAGVERRLGQVPGDDNTWHSSRSLLEDAGGDLQELFFPHADPQSKLAQEWLSRLAAAGEAKGVPDGLTAKTLFVRVVPKKPNLILTPLNLLPAPTPAHPHAFLGEIVNVESALEIEDNATYPQCVSNWELFVPATTLDGTDVTYTAVVNARDKFAAWISKIRSNCTDCVKETEGDFSQWLASGPQIGGQAVVTLSHHAPQALYFRSDSATSPTVVNPLRIRRDYSDPSLGILAGCGTGEVGASEFVRQFNYAGMHSIIAASTEVDGEMAGDFLTALLNNLSSSAHRQDPHYGIGAARFDAVKALKGQYDALPLLFVLAGNGTIRACPP